MKYSFKINMMAFAVAGVLAGMGGFSGDAFAAKGSPGPPEGGGRPGGETLGNNLSYAAMIVGGGGPTLRLGCQDTAIAPSGPECTLYPGYWCQKTDATWSAACTTATVADGVEVTATWGANLLGDASLKAGRPIRVEMVLTESGGITGNPGYVVVNLTPTLEDRLSTYGTNGTMQYTDYTVYDNGAKLKIEQCQDETCAVIVATPLREGIATAELNSMGNIVYGYNWGTKGKASAPAAGIYKLTFTANNTTIVSNPGAQSCTEGNCTFVIINVSPGGSGGGKPPGAGEGE
jgi:hypothetical protein